MNSALSSSSSTGAYSWRRRPPSTCAMCSGSGRGRGAVRRLRSGRRPGVPRYLRGPWSAERVHLLWLSPDDDHDDGADHHLHDDHHDRRHHHDGRFDHHDHHAGVDHHDHGLDDHDHGTDHHHHHHDRVHDHDHDDGVDHHDHHDADHDHHADDDA